MYQATQYRMSVHGGRFDPKFKKSLDLGWHTAATVLLLERDSLQPTVFSLTIGTIPETVAFVKTTRH